VLRHGQDSLLAAVALLSKLSPNLPEQNLAPPAAGSSGYCCGQHAVVASADRGGVGRADTGRLADTNRARSLQVADGWDIILFPEPQ
jgi:hypothetical protein